MQEQFLQSVLSSEPFISELIGYFLRKVKVSNKTIKFPKTVNTPKSITLLQKEGQGRFSRGDSHNRHVD